MSFPYITTKYVNGKSWYRIWSDGWIEQGGYGSNASNYTATITLLKKFKDSNYNITIVGNATERVTYGYNFAYTLTTTSFKVVVPNASYWWRACGY